MQRTLYEPCYAAHSPQLLQKIVADKIARIIIISCIPSQLKISANLEAPDPKLDQIIVGHPKENAELHKLIRERFKLVKKWWQENDWFMHLDSPVRDLIQDCVSHVLDHMDYYSLCPLFRLTCQLCFTKEAGLFKQDTGHQIVLQLPKTYCSQYSSFLEYLGTFQILHLRNTHIIFGNPEPLVVILKNVPLLKSIYLRHNSCGYTLEHVGKYCPNIEEFIVQDTLGKLCVSETYLYTTFFKGLQKRELIENCINGNVPVKLSFANLKCLDVGRSSSVQEFLFYVNFFYPNLVSLTCNSQSLHAGFLQKTLTKFSHKFVSYNIQDICLSSNCLITLDRRYIWKILPKVKHITLVLDCVPSKEVEKLKFKMKEFLRLFVYSSLTIHIPFDSVEDRDLEDILLPLLNLVGFSIKALQFELMRTVYAKTIWKLINACINLELLAIKLSVDAELENSYNMIKLNNLNDLKSFSVSYKQSNNVAIFLSYVNEVIESSPNITSLELMLPGSSSNWVITVAAKGLLKNVTTLIFRMHCNSEPVLDIDFYVIIVEALTSLKKLVLMNVPPAVLSHMIKIFRTSQLQVLPGRRKSLVAYCGLGAKYIQWESR